MNKIKTSAVVAVVCASLYGFSVYMFTENMYRLFDKLPLNSRKYASVDAYKFQINTVHPKK